MSVEAECALTELPPSQCACPNHRGGLAPAEDVETVGQPFDAAYGGTCGRCEGPIRPGQQIVRAADRDLGYLHVGRCPTT